MANTELELVAVVGVAGLDVREHRLKSGLVAVAVLGMDRVDERPRVLVQFLDRPAVDVLVGRVDVQHLGQVGVGEVDDLVDPLGDGPEPALELAALGELDEIVQTGLASVENDPAEDVGTEAGLHGAGTDIDDESAGIASSDEVLQEQLAKIDAESEAIVDPEEIVQERPADITDPDEIVQERPADITDPDEIVQKRPATADPESGATVDPDEAAPDG